MNCQCAERVTILSLCVCIGIAESWVLHCLSRVSYRWGKKREEKEKNTAKRKWWRLKHEFVCLCGKRVKYMCVSEREAGEKIGSDCNLFLSYFISERQRRFCKIQWEIKNDSSSVNAESRTLRLRSAWWFTDTSELSEQPLRCLRRVPIHICLGLLQTPSGRVTWRNKKKKVDFHKVITS